ncbi:MAG: hypothetical protein PHN80_10560 [Hespellia sp.]|nr:hypothetical protein [Hespellia sp.]
MRLKSKRRFQMNMGIVCSLAVLFTASPVWATDTDSLENQSSALQQQLQGINSEILDMGTEIADIEIQIDDTNNAIVSTEEQLSIIKNNESVQYDAMKRRIQFMYENGNSTMLEILFSSKNIADFVNKADFIQNITTYDREQLIELQNTLTTIAEQQAKLGEQKSSLEEMEAELQTKQDALNAKAAETSTNINELTTQIAQIKEAQQKAAEEKAAKEAADAQAKAAADAASQQAAAQQAAVETSVPDSGNSSQSAASDASDSSSAPSYSVSGGGLTPSKGVVYYNGHRETYYSQKVLPGNGLNIPGRHVAEDGTIRDADNYICVASSDFEKGTVVETSLGMGKVYDSGCASGTIDLYTNW